MLCTTVVEHMRIIIKGELCPRALHGSLIFSALRLLKLCTTRTDSLAILILLEAAALTRVSSDMQTYYSRSFIHLDIRINLSTCIHYYYNVTQCLNVV